MQAAISVGPSGTGTLTFDATPPASEWSTVNLGGGSGDVTTAAALEADVIANLDAAAVTTALGTSSTLPISANALARRHTSQNWLQTPPTGVKYSVLMATLQNNSGADLVGVDVSYDLGDNVQAGATTVEEIPGHRVFYSQTGAPGSWAVATALSGGTAGTVSGTINLGTWAQGALLYIVWADDNAAADRNNSGNEEGGYTIDNWQVVGVLPPRPKDLVFQQGLEGYTGTRDTYLRYASADTVFGGAGSVLTDQDDGGGEIHALIRFDDIFGAAMTQIPPGAVIRSASLTIEVTNESNDSNVIGLHRMLVPWDQTTSTWNTLVNGVSADDIEALATPDVTFTVTATGTRVIQIPVTSLQAWSDGANNYGWVMISTGTDGVDFHSSESLTLANRPKLMVSWGAAGEPIIKALNGMATGFTLVLEDGDPPGDVNPGTVAATLNGAPVTVGVSKAGAVTTIVYASPTLLPAGSTNSLSVTLKHTGTQTMVIEQDFVVPAYEIVPASLAATGVDTSKPGFRVYPYQSGGWDADTTQPNDLAWTEDQVAGLHGENYAALFTAEADGSYIEPAVINYSGEAGTGTERGNFTGDVAFPGIPGLFATTGNSAIEAVAFLYFPAAGTYRMGVNSDDGFRVTVGKNPRDRFALNLGEFDGGRGAADTLFDLVIEQPGYYPCRLLWENGNGELPGNQLNCEWFTVSPDGTKILVNDISNPAAVRAYYSGPLSVFVRWYNPKPGEVDVPGSSTIDFMLGDGSPNTVLGSIQLWVDGGSVIPGVNKPAGTNITLVTYDPPGELAPEETHTVRLAFSDNAAPAYWVTNEYQFVTAPTTIPLIAIDETTLWRYDQSFTDLGTAWKEKNYDDSTWLQGAALLGSESGTTAEPMRTYVALGSWVTYYFRIHFNYSGPSGVRLRLRHVLDDGAVFYLNGTEVHRFGLAAGASFDANTTFADHENQYEGPFLLPTASLVQGDNVLAVEVHQTSATSSDLVFGAVLDALTSNLARSTVESVTPAPDATDVPRETTIGLTVVDGTSTVQAGSVKLWVNGAQVTPVVNKPVGSGVTTISYNPGTSLPYGLPVSVKVEYTDDGPAPNVTTYEWTYQAALETIVLFAVDATTQWRYEVTGQNLGTAWKEPGYNDSAWPLGAALLADETGATVEPIRTPFARNGIITFYFRHHFNYTRQLTDIALNLRHVVDDGAVFYLNGVEVFRTDNMPPGPVNYQTLAIVDQENAWRGPYIIPAASLINGDNVFAVEVHQNSATSSDVVFGAELKATLTPPSSPPEFTSVSLEPGGLRIEWTGGGTLEESDSVTGGWATATSQANPQVIPTTAPRKFYRLKR